MKSKKSLIWIISGVLTIGLAFTIFYTTEDDIAATVNGEKMQTEYTAWLDEKFEEYQIENFLEG